MISRSQIRPLLILFFIFAFVKIFFSFFLNGPTTFPDEACFALKAMDFVDNLDFRSCEEVSGVESGGEFPLYIFFISPIYLFFGGKATFYALMIFQSLISAAMIFPIFSIFKKFISNNKTSLLLSSVFLFLPQVFVYEKSMMSEFLFIVLNVWFLFFYLKSFEKNSLKYKFLSYVFALLGALTRPFGFILPLALIINELIVYKKKRYLIYLFVAICLSFLFLFVFSEKGVFVLADKFKTLIDPSNYLLILRAIINQINTFTISLFMLPLLVFFYFFPRKDSKFWKSIKYFFLFFILFNFLISAQHIYGYFLEDNELHLLTRYVNMSLIYLLLVSFIFLSKYKKFKINLKFIFVFFFLVLLFLFLEKTGKRVQNIEISAFYTVINQEDSRTQFMYFLKIPLLLSFVGLIYLFMKNKFIWARNFLIIGLISVSIFSYLLIRQVPYDTSLTDYVIANPSNSITYVISPKNRDYIHFWKFMAYSHYDIKKVVNFDEDVFVLNPAGFETDLIITFYDLPGYEVMGYSHKKGLIYKVYKQKK